jgi:hypothetical protein
MQTSSSRSQSSFSIKVASTSGKDDMAAMEEQAMHKVGSGTVGEARVVKRICEERKEEGAGLEGGRGDMEVFVDG